MSDFDTWFNRQAEEYWKPCEPELDRDGEYKCWNCDDRNDCDAWKELNDDI